MEIMELAKELGLRIKDDIRVINMNKASSDYETDRELQNAVLEYNTQRTALNEEYKKDTHDTEFISAIEKRIKELYNIIVENPNMKKYNDAQKAVNEFMNEVNSEISYQITGKRPCSHDDCSSCHGCN